MSKEAAIVEYLKGHGASFFQGLHDGVGGGYPGETLEALWGLVWKGLLTNDGMAALRAYCERPASSSSRKPVRRVNQQAVFRSRRTTPPTAQGRWALNGARLRMTPSATEWSHAIAQQLLTRYGVVFRETAHAENLPGGFSAIYDVMKALEESGKIRRGYFAAGPRGDTVCNARRGRSAAFAPGRSRTRAAWRCCSWRLPIRQTPMGR